MLTSNWEMLVPGYTNVIHRLDPAAFVDPIEVLQFRCSTYLFHPATCIVLSRDHERLPSDRPNLLILLLIWMKLDSVPFKADCATAHSRYASVLPELAFLSIN